MSEKPKPVLMQKGCILRVTVKETGGVRVTSDMGLIHDLPVPDILYLVGCMRQLESVLLGVCNDRDDVAENNED